MKDFKKILNGAIEEAQEYITAHNEMQEVERDIEILDKAYYYIDIRFDKLEYDFQEFLNDLEITLSKDQNDEVLQVIEDTFGKYYDIGGYIDWDILTIEQFENDMNVIKDKLLKMASK